MRTRTTTALLLAIAGLATTAAADEGQTHATSVSPIFLQGTLQGCSVSFDVVRQDAEYSRNAPVQVSGSLTFWAMAGKEHAVGLKLGTSPVGSNSPPTAPATAYLVSDFGTNAADLVGSQLSDTPGFRVFAFAISDETLKALTPGFEPGVFRFAYAPAGGVTGAITAVDLNVSSVASGQQVVDGKSRATWALCINRLLKIDEKGQ